MLYNSLDINERAETAAWWAEARRGHPGEMRASASYCSGSLAFLKFGANGVALFEGAIVFLRDSFFGGGTSSQGGFFLLPVKIGFLLRVAGCKKI